MAEIDDLREEVAYWRRDAYARLWSDSALHDAAKLAGDSGRVSDLRVNRIMPTLAALREAGEKAWHLTCEGCGAPLLNGQRYLPFEDANGVHVDCANPAAARDEPGSLIWDDGFGAGAVMNILQQATAIADDCDPADQSSTPALGARTAVQEVLG